MKLKPRPFKLSFNTSKVTSTELNECLNSEEERKMIKNALPTSVVLKRNVNIEFLRKDQYFCEIHLINKKLIIFQR